MRWFSRNAAFVCKLPERGVGSRISLIVTRREHCWSRRGCVLLSASHHARVFAAVHVVRECNRTAIRRPGGVVQALRRKFKKGKSSFIAGLVEELGVDGDYARFWLFVSGLLSESHCESLLCAIANKVTAARDGAGSKLSRLLLLLLHCHSECVTKLPREGSPAVAMVMKSVGLQLRFTHVSASDARAAADVVQQYSSSVKEISLFSTMMDDTSPSIVIAGLQNCTGLTRLNPGLPAMQPIPKLLPR